MIKRYLVNGLINDDLFTCARTVRDKHHMCFVPGSLDKKGGTMFHLLLSKRWNLDGIFFPLFVQRT
jgi:hypothetical protein